MNYVTNFAPQYTTFLSVKYSSGSKSIIECQNDEKTHYHMTLGLGVI